MQDNFKGHWVRTIQGEEIETIKYFINHFTQTLLNKLFFYTTEAVL